MTAGGSTVVVIGAGAAGLSAAWHAARRGHAVTVVDPAGPGGQLLTSGLIESMPGLPPRCTGPDLVERLCQQLAELPTSWVDERVVDVRRRATRFVLTTDGGRELGADAVIAAYGATNRPLGVPGEDAFEHRGVTYCAVCDGPLFRGRAVAVVGGGDAAAEGALHLAAMCPEVHLVHRDGELTALDVWRRRLEAVDNIRITPRASVRAIVGNEHGVTGLEVETGDSGPATIDVRAVFVAIGMVTDPAPVAGLVELDRSGCIAVGPALMSSAAGLFAAGACRACSSGQLAGAIGDGVAAAAGVDRWLAGHGDSPERPPREEPASGETVGRTFFDDSAFFDAADAAGIGDGLPLVPPTAERMRRFADALGADPGDLLAMVHEQPISFGPLLSSAIMAGCRPEFMPVLAAAATSLLGTAQPGTNPDRLAVVVVNGPARHALDLNCTDGCFGPGWRSNATIGRALRLFIHDHVATRGPTGFGDPGQYAFCFGEDEEGSPWVPLHVQHGLAHNESAVTVFDVDVFRQVMDREHTDPEQILSYVSLFLRGRASGTRLFGSTPLSLLLVVGQQLRGQLATRWTKDALARTLLELVTCDDGTPLGPIDIRQPGDIAIVAAGGVATPTLWCFVSAGPAARCVPIVRGGLP